MHPSQNQPCLDKTLLGSHVMIWDYSLKFEASGLSLKTLCDPDSLISLGLTSTALFVMEQADHSYITLRNMWKLSEQGRWVVVGLTHLLSWWPSRSWQRLWPGRSLVPAPRWGIWAPLPTEDRERDMLPHSLLLLTNNRRASHLKA